MTDSTAPAQTPARQRLEQLRAEAAEREATTATTDAATIPGDGPRILQVGETFHAVHDGLTLPRTVQLFGGRPALITKRASSYVLDDEMVEASRNKYGDLTWTTLVYDEQAQVRRWGRIYLRPGPPPEGMESWLPGGREWSEARERAMMAANDHSDPLERADAVAQVNARFGGPPASNASSTVYRGDDGDLPRGR